MRFQLSPKVFEPLSCPPCPETAHAHLCWQLLQEAKVSLVPDTDQELRLVLSQQRHHVTSRAQLLLLLLLLLD
jgi:hypothetical protein